EVMEFEVRSLGGIESCFVSLPLPLIQTLQSGYHPPILAIELRSDARLWHVAWCGSASSSASAIEVSRQYADCIGLSDGTVVNVRFVSNLTKATLVTIEPLTEDDWEILELNSEVAESSILKQVGVVYEEMRFPLWLHGQTVVRFLVVSVFPQKRVAQLVPGTEVAVAPKRRKHASSKETKIVAKAQLRVQDCHLTHRFEEKGLRVDVLFTSGVLIHPETAKQHSFNALQCVVISPRPCFQDKSSPYSKASRTGKEEFSDHPNGEKDIGKPVVRLLLSDLVAKGHIMISQTLRLYLGARLHSWVNVKTHVISITKDVTHLSISPFNFKMSPNDTFQTQNPESAKAIEKLKGRNIYNDIRSSKPEIGISDWLMHDKFVAALTSGSFLSEAKDTAVETGEKHTKEEDGLPFLLRAWCFAQLKTFISNSAEGVKLLTLGSKSLIHLKVKNGDLSRYRMKLSNEIYPRSRREMEESSVDILYILSLSGVSADEKSSFAYELDFNDFGCHSYASKGLDILLGKLQLGDIISYNFPYETAASEFSSTISSLNWMGNAPLDVNHRLKALLAPGSGIFFSSCNVMFPGHILISGPSGSGKTILSRISAKSVEECKDIFAHVVFVSCSRLTLEKPQTVRQILSGYISEALDCAPSVIILDDLDSLVSPASDLEGSQPSLSSAALIEFLTDILDEYSASLLFYNFDAARSVCGIGPVAFIATAQSLTSFPQSLSSSGQFDFHVNLPVPAAAERCAILKHEIQKRLLQCSDELLSDIASKCDGYDAYDLEILVDRSVHAAIGRSFSANLLPGENEKPTLVKDNFLVAMDNFLPVAMRDITKPGAEAGRSGWEDVGGLTDIQNSIKEMIELPSKFQSVFGQAPLRMRSNVLLYGPPGCGKTHIVGAAAGACSLRFISVKGPELLNKYIGASEQAVR
ncbi:hypothetical protein M569_04916, partial [Genlisea aurea]